MARLLTNGDLEILELAQLYCGSINKYIGYSSILFKAET